MIIAIEAASSDPSLALTDRDGGLIASDAWSADARQGSLLLVRLEALLATAGRRPDEATAIAVGIGPGSFTGLRVAMSVAKGLAFGLQRPILGIPSLAAWLAAAPDADAAAARGGAQEAWLLERGAGEPQLMSREMLAPRSMTGRLLAPAELAAAFGLAGTLPPARGAIGVAMLAAHRLAAGEHDDLRTLEPAYRRAPRGTAQLGGVGG